MSGFQPKACFKVLSCEKLFCGLINSFEVSREHVEAQATHSSILKADSRTGDISCIINYFRATLAEDIREFASEICMATEKVSQILGILIWSPIFLRILSLISFTLCERVKTGSLISKIKTTARWPIIRTFVCVSTRSR